MNEKTNTARILAGQKPLITSFWCKFGWHNWTQWSKSFDSDTQTLQDSYCINCNYRRARRVDTKSWK